MFDLSGFCTGRSGRRRRVAGLSSSPTSLAAASLHINGRKPDHTGYHVLGASRSPEAPARGPSTGSAGARSWLAPIRSKQVALSDEMLMTLIKDQHDSRAFRAFYDRHSTLAFSLAMRILHDRGLAADATQEAFLALWHGRAAYNPDKSTGKSWLLRMLQNRALDIWRREHKRQSELTGDDSHLPVQVAPEQTENQAIAGDESRRIRALLNKLPPTQHQVIELSYFAGLTHTEIAERLGLPLGTTKGRIRLALTKLRDALNDPRAVYTD